MQNSKYKFEEYYVAPPTKIWLIIKKNEINFFWQNINILFISKLWHVMLYYVIVSILLAKKIKYKIIFFLQN